LILAHANTNFNFKEIYFTIIVIVTVSLIVGVGVSVGLSYIFIYPLQVIVQKALMTIFILTQLLIFLLLFMSFFDLLL